MESHWFLYIFVLMAVQDGTLRIFEWPSMKTILNESNAHGEVKNLTFRSILFMRKESSFEQ